MTIRKSNHGEPGGPISRLRGLQARFVASELPTITSSDTGWSLNSSRVFGEPAPGTVLQIGPPKLLQIHRLGGETLLISIARRMHLASVRSL